MTRVRCGTIIESSKSRACGSCREAGRTGERIDSPPVPSSQQLVDDGPRRRAMQEKKNERRFGSCCVRGTQARQDNGWSACDTFVKLCTHPPSTVRQHPTIAPPYPNGSATATTPPNSLLPALDHVIGFESLLPSQLTHHLWLVGWLVGRFSGAPRCRSDAGDSTVCGARLVGACQSVREREPVSRSLSRSRLLPQKH
jgi:hypothetical protein